MIRDLLAPVWAVGAGAAPGADAVVAAIPGEAWVPIPYWSSEGVFGYHDGECQTSV